MTLAQMRQIDALLTGSMGMSLLQLMECAGFALARLAAARLGGSVQRCRVTVLAGHGHNGGGAMVAARRLSAWGAAVQVIVLPGPLKGVTSMQRNILRHQGVRISDSSQMGHAIEAADLVVDGLVGYGLRGPLRGPAAQLAATANASGRPILALDVPSGLSADTGRAAPGTIRAGATLTLALPKQGLAGPGSETYTGRLYLADIGVPPRLYRKIGLRVPPAFDGRTYVALRRSSAAAGEPRSTTAQSDQGGAG